MVLWQFSPPSRRESRCSCLHAQCPGLESGPETIGGVKIQLAILDILDEQERVLLGQVEMLSTDASFGFLQQATFEFWSHEPVLFLQFFGLGCVLLTLYTGERPFPVQSSLQHLAVMQRVIGSLTRVPLKNRS